MEARRVSVCICIKHYFLAKALRPSAFLRFHFSNTVKKKEMPQYIYLINSRA